MYAYVCSRPQPQPPTPMHIIKCNMLNNWWLIARPHKKSQSNKQTNKIGVCVWQGSSVCVLVSNLQIDSNNDLSYNLCHMVDYSYVI